MASCMEEVVPESMLEVLQRAALTEGNSPFCERTARTAIAVVAWGGWHFAGVKRIVTQEPAMETLDRAVVWRRPAVLAIAGGIRTDPSGTTRSLLAGYSRASTLADSAAAM